MKLNKTFILNNEKKVKKPKKNILNYTTRENKKRP